jgi:hypothetical protein
VAETRQFWGIAVIQLEAGVVRRDGLIRRDVLDVVEGWERVRIQLQKIFGLDISRLNREQRDSAVGWRMPEPDR